MIIVGSSALKFHFPEIDRVVNDIDVIGDQLTVNHLIDLLQPTKIKSNDFITTLIGIKSKFGIWTHNNVEILMSDKSKSLKSYLDYEKNKTDFLNPFASKEVLFSLKKSHIHFPIKFEKHIKDYCFLYDQLKGVDELESITKLNFKETEERLGKLKTPSLKKTTKEFFGQSENFVKSYFIHDDIHRVMAHYERPLYERMKKNHTLVDCEKKKWDEFTFDDKCKCVLEEAYVIALERKILPMLFGKGSYFSSEEALDWSLMRISTTLCSGWFRQFTTDNFFRIKEYINTNYIEKFLEAYQNGTINKI